MQAVSPNLYCFPIGKPCLLGYSSLRVRGCGEDGEVILVSAEQWLAFKSGHWQIIVHLFLSPLVIIYGKVPGDLAIYEKCPVIIRYGLVGDSRIVP